MADAQTQKATDTEGAQDNSEGNPSPGDHGDDPTSPESQAEHPPSPKKNQDQMRSGEFRISPTLLILQCPPLLEWQLLTPCQL